MKTKTKIPGNGLSIAGMILGIIAFIWMLFELIVVGDINTGVDKLKDIPNIETVSISLIYFCFAFGYTMFSLIPSFIGLLLSIFGLKKEKTGKNITGIILNSIAFIVSIIIFIYIMSLAG